MSHVCRNGLSLRCRGVATENCPIRMTGAFPEAESGGCLENWPIRDWSPEHCPIKGTRGGSRKTTQSEPGEREDPRAAFNQGAGAGTPPNQARRRARLRPRGRGPGAAAHLPRAVSCAHLPDPRARGEEPRRARSRAARW